MQQGDRNNRVVQSLDLRDKLIDTEYWLVEVGGQQFLVVLRERPKNFQIMFTIHGMNTFDYGVDWPLSPAQHGAQRNEKNFVTAFLCTVQELAYLRCFLRYIVRKIVNERTGQSDVWRQSDWLVHSKIRVHNQRSSFETLKCINETLLVLLKTVTDAGVALHLIIEWIRADAKAAEARVLRVR